jgi:phosphatidylglycerol---prolipoprotein diacylglyceryl transferase
MGTMQFKDNCLTHGGRPLSSAAMIDFPNIDPVAFSIGPFAVRWYALAYIAALIFAIWYAKRLVGNKALWADRNPTLTPQQVDDLFIWLALGVILGGRLGYVLFYSPAHFLNNPLDIVRMWEGGMSFHGGFLGVVVALLIYGKRHGATLDRLLDLGAAATPVGLGLGRLANFINGELYGRPGDVPWAMVFPNDPLQAPRHPSQLYEAILEGLVLFLIVRIATHRFTALAHPGRASGLFALGYGLSRITVEFFREPDAQLGYFLGFITMGMTLSLPLVAIGVWLLLRSRHT